MSTDLPAYRIHPDTRIGPVHLKVADLDGQLRFYQQVLGLQLHWRDGRDAGLGAGGPDLLGLHELPGARRAPHTTGLYHFALLLPDRKELARAMGRLVALRYPNYPTDHIMTKTTYLDDPEGQNIELYADTPEDGWFGFEDGNFVARRSDGTLSDGREPLDVQALLQHLTAEDRLDQPMPGITRMGHVHLYVSDLESSLRFYHGLLGFDNMGLSPTFRAAFVSAGGYHHHIGLNTWVGQGAPAPPPGSLGLQYFAVVLPAEKDLDQLAERILAAGLDTQELPEGMLVRDPSQNGVLLTHNDRR